MTEFLCERGACSVPAEVVNSPEQRAGLDSLGLTVSEKVIRGLCVGGSLLDGDPYRMEEANCKAAASECSLDRTLLHIPEIQGEQ